MEPPTRPSAPTSCVSPNVKEMGEHSESGSASPAPNRSISSSLSSVDSSWNWNQAQTADGRTYYFNEKKQVKWKLSLEEKMKMLQTLELSFRKMEGFMYKRAPRHTDSDRPSIFRMMTPHQSLFKRRYFVLEPSQKTLFYYPDTSKSPLLGTVDLTSVTAVSTNVKDKSDLTQLPTEYVLNVTTLNRVWTFVCNTGEEQAAWNQCMQLMIFQNTHLFQPQYGTTANLLSPQTAAHSLFDSGAGEKKKSTIVQSVKGKNSRVSTNESIATKIEHTLARKAENGPDVDVVFHEDIRSMNKKKRGSRLVTMFGGKSQESGEKEGKDTAGETNRRMTRLFKSPTSPYGGDMEKQEEIVEPYRARKGQAFMTGNLPLDCPSICASFDFPAMPFFRTLTRLGCEADKLKEFLDLKSRIVFVKEGDYIVEENGAIKSIHIIMSGEFLRQKNIHGDQYGISVLESGAFSSIEEFFTLSLGSYITSVVAGCHGVVLELDAPGFGTFLTSQGVNTSFPDFFIPFISDLLSCVPLLLDLLPTTLKLIAAEFKVKKFLKKDRIFSVHAKAAEFVIVMNGTAKATHETPSGTQIVGLYSSGDWMNDEAIRQGRNYAVDLTSVSDTVFVLTCSITGFEKVLKLGGSDLNNSIHRVVSGRLAQAMSKCPLFFGMNALTSKFAEFMHFDEVPAGTVICKQGGKCDGFYIILSGTMEVSVGEVLGIKLRRSVVKDVLGINDFFGGSWLLSQSLGALATVKATSHCVLLRTPAESFNELCKICPLLETRLRKMREQEVKSTAREEDLVSAVRDAVRLGI